MNQSWLPTLIFVPLFAFGMYLYYRRTFGKQRYRPRSMIARGAFLSAICTVFLVGLQTSAGFGAAAAGAAVGIALGVFGLVHTTYEVNGATRYYTPNGWIGLVVTALFLGRMAARMVSLFQNVGTTVGLFTQMRRSGPFTDMQRSPLTLGLFFLLAGYYVCYYSGVIRKVRALAAASPRPATPPAIAKSG